MQCPRMYQLTGLVGLSVDLGGADIIVLCETRKDVCVLEWKLLVRML
jgi:hypothetical protein